MVVYGGEKRIGEEVGRMLSRGDDGMEERKGYGRARHVGKGKRMHAGCNGRRTVREE